MVSYNVHNFQSTREEAKLKKEAYFFLILSTSTARKLHIEYSSNVCGKVVHFSNKNFKGPIISRRSSIFRNLIYPSAQSQHLPGEGQLNQTHDYPHKKHTFNPVPERGQLLKCKKGSIHSTAPSRGQSTSF